MKTAKLMISTIAVGLALLALAASASAYSLAGFEATTSTSTAGAHPDLTTDLVFPTKSLGAPLLKADGNVRDTVVQLPAGMVGDPSAVPQCSQSDFQENACAPDAQVGSVKLTLLLPNHRTFAPTLPVFNMKPSRADETAEIAFSFGGLVVVHLPIWSAPTATTGWT